MRGLSPRGSIPFRATQRSLRFEKENWRFAKENWSGRSSTRAPVLRVSAPQPWLVSRSRRFRRARRRHVEKIFQRVRVGHHAHQIVAGRPLAPNAESAIEKAIEEFQITNPEQQKQLVATGQLDLSLRHNMRAFWQSMMCSAGPCTTATSTAARAIARSLVRAIPVLRCGAQWRRPRARWRTVLN